jgi:hypothetical protein
MLLDSLTFSGGINVGNTFCNNKYWYWNANTTGRNAGISTAQGELNLQLRYWTRPGFWHGTSWRDVGKKAMNATGGYVNEYTDAPTGRIYRFISLRLLVSLRFRLLLLEKPLTTL